MSPIEWLDGIMVQWYDDTMRWQIERCDLIADWTVRWCDGTVQLFDVIANWTIRCDARLNDFMVRLFDVMANWTIRWQIGIGALVR